MNKYEYLPMQEYCLNVTDGTHATPKEVQYGYPLVTSKNLNNGRLDLNNTYLISESDYNEINIRSKVDKNDVLISMIGTVGLVCFVDRQPDFAIKNVGLLKNKDEFHGKWLYYYLSSPEGQYSIQERLRGTTQQYIPLNEIRKLPVKVLFSTDDMKKIVNFLSYLDDKIELNAQINHNLEEQAKAIFKSWFVDATESNTWDSVPLKELVTTMRNGDWGKDTPCGNNTEVAYCIRGADIPDVNAGNKGKMPIRYILPKNYEKKHLVEGDIVVEISGGSPTQSTGRCAVISQALLDRYEQKIVCTNFCKALKPLDGYSHFLYYYWTYLYEKGCFFAYENGTTGIKNLDITGIIENEFLQLPPIEIIEKFNELCDKIASTIFANGTETERLAQLRDTLLPKLMSGELDVSEVRV